MMKKFASLFILVIGALVITLGIIRAVQKNNDPTTSLTRLNVHEARRFSDDPLIGFTSSDGLNTPTPPQMSGEGIYYVRTGAQGEGERDGSFENPWQDLQQALCRLAPGDTLVVQRGGFGEVSVDERCVGGTPQAPIKVYFSSETGLAQSDEGAPATLVVSQPHWFFYGIQMTLGDARTGVIIAPGTQGVLLESMKISGGTGVGVFVGEGATDITIARSHIHHIGINASGDDTDPEAVASAAVVLARGGRGIRLLENKFHHIGGESLFVLPALIGPDGSDLIPAAQYEVDEITLTPSEDDRWWEEIKPPQTESTENKP